MSLAAAMAAVGVAEPAAAHPHMFFDAKATLMLDDQGRLGALRLSYLVDPLNTLTILTDLGLDTEGPLSKESAAAVLDAFTGGLAEYGWYAALSRGEKPLSFGEPVGRSAVAEGENLRVVFDLPLAAPFAPDAEPVTLQLYDPTYFTDVGIVAAPAVSGPGAENCTVEWRKFQPDAEALAAQAALALVPADQTPEEAEVGRRFADHVYLRCAAGHG